MNNAIVNKGYKARNVQLVADKDGIIHGPEWHSAHMNRLADFVTKLADNCDDVRAWLEINRPAEYQPKDMLSNATLVTT